jgi:DNA-binding NtrC family response regulator
MIFFRLLWSSGVNLGGPGMVTIGTVGDDTARLDVLVVDDWPEMASSSAEVLRFGGLKVATASSLEEGLQVIATRGVRAIIVDHHLAGNDGSSFLAMGENLPPVIVVSGIDRDVLAELQVAHGDQLFACLAKPVPPLKLIEVVRAAVESN